MLTLYVNEFKTSEHITYPQYKAEYIKSYTL